jgi:mono/diheme cytochrome c family protein
MKILWAVGLVVTIVAAVAAQAVKTVWDGVYSDAQAGRGKKAYITHCAECHNEGLQGGDLAPALKGDDFLLQWNDKSMAELFERTQKTMPQNNPGGLMPQETADILAYVLQVNRMPGGSADLSADPAALKAIAITKTK